MAGIMEAKELSYKLKNTGVVIAEGITSEESKYLIIRLDNDKGVITQFDYGSDLEIDKEIQVGNKVKLTLVNEYHAKWEIRV